MQNKSQTYIKLIDLLFKLGRESVESAVYSSQLSNGSFNRTNSGAKSFKFPQPVVIANAGLSAICTIQEWYIVGIISRELKEYNALWQCNEDIKRNTTQRYAIKGLLEKGILIKTETTNIYLVNPVHIRRGDLFTVITTTAHILEDESCVGIEHITNKKPVKEFNVKGYLPSP